MINNHFLEKSRYWKYALIMLNLIVFPFSWAGPRVNNGGGVWVCKNSVTKKVQWIKAVDFWELSMTWADSKFEPVQAQSAWGIYQEKLNEIYASFPELTLILQKNPLDLKSVIREVSGMLDFVDDNQLIRKPDDFFCENGDVEYGQVADFLVDGNLLISQALWNDPGFSEIDKAGVLLHELIYKALRDERDEQNSERTQKIVYFLFSNLSLQEKQKQVRLILEAKGGVRGRVQVSPFSIHLNCEVKVTSYSISQVPSLLGSISWKQIQSIEKNVQIEDFSFLLKRNLEDGRPIQMEITDLKTGGIVSLDDFMIKPVFFQNRKVYLELKRMKPLSQARVVQFSCDT